jgi:hypothetical protein
MVNAQARQEMLNHLQQLRQGSPSPGGQVGPPPMQAGPRPGGPMDRPEQPSDDVQIITDVKMLLAKALELLSNIGPGNV